MTRRTHLRLPLALSVAFSFLSFAPGIGQCRNEDVDVLHYRFHLTLSDSSNLIRGRAEVTARFLAAGVEELHLDLVGRASGMGPGMSVQEVAVEGEPAPYTHAANCLAISTGSPPRADEVRTYSVAYEGIPGDGLIIDTNMFGDRTFFGDNWPERARHWLPTVDHPSDKAIVEWFVTAPEGYDVVGNGRLVERSRLDGRQALTHWESMAPLPTKVMVIGVARFAMRTTGYLEGIPVQAWVYPQNREAGFHDFALAEDPLRFFQDQIGPFPYAKLANVQSRTRYGGMENASAIFYTEAAVRGDRLAEGLIVHEVAHQWFGDSVTEADWPHLWLSEGFATYLAHCYNEHAYGRGALVEGMEQDRREVLSFFAQEPDMPLVPDSVADPEEALNPNAYQKGGWLLHMLRRQVGDEAFWSGIQTYYREFRDDNASTDDLRRVMEAVSGLDLTGFFQQWARRPGHPVLEGEWRYDPDAGQVTVTIRQVQRDTEPFRFPLDLGVEGEDGSVHRVETVQVSQRDETFQFPSEEPPSQIVLDPDTWLLFQGELAKARQEQPPTGT